MTESRTIGRLRRITGPAGLLAVFFAVPISLAAAQNLPSDPQMRDPQMREADPRVREAAPKPQPQRDSSKVQIVEFDTAPFPYNGNIPEKNTPFFDVIKEGRRGHASPRGGVYWEDLTYSDRRVLLSIPKHFDPQAPAAIVVFLHGNLARIDRDVRLRQQVTRQLSDSGINAVLVAPQFAVQALDSSAGRFWQKGAFNEFLNEAAYHLANLTGDERLRPVFTRAPVILVAYSGGYLPAAYALTIGGAENRIGGVILLDALYADTEKFADWVVQRHDTFFFSAHSNSTRAENLALQKMLRDKNVPTESGLPQRLIPGTVAFLGTGPEVVHNDFVTRAWVQDPLKLVLSRVAGYTVNQAAAVPIPRARPIVPAANSQKTEPTMNNGKIEGPPAPEELPPPPQEMTEPLPPPVARQASPQRPAPVKPRILPPPTSIAPVPR